MSDFSHLLAAGHKPGSNEYAAAVDSYAALIGRAAEFIEAVTEKVACAFVGPGEKITLAKVKKERRHIDVICNKLKHNQNFLAHVTATADDGRTVCGFSVYTIDAAGEQHPNREIHREAEAFALAMEIRRAVVDCYVISERVSDFIAQQGPVIIPSMHQPSHADSQRLELLRRLSELPTTCFPFERGPYPSVTVDGQEVAIRPSGGEAQRLPGSVKMVLSATPYLGALKIKVPL